MHKIIIFACDLFLSFFCASDAFMLWSRMVRNRKAHSKKRTELLFSSPFQHRHMLINFVPFFFCSPAVVQLKCEVRQRIMNLTKFSPLLYQGWDLWMWFYLVFVKTSRLLFTTVPHNLCRAKVWLWNQHAEEYLHSFIWTEKKINRKLKISHWKILTKCYI